MVKAAIPYQVDNVHNPPGMKPLSGYMLEHSISLPEVDTMLLVMSRGKGMPNL